MVVVGFVELFSEGLDILTAVLLLLPVDEVVAVAVAVVAGVDFPTDGVVPVNEVDFD